MAENPENPAAQRPALAWPLLLAAVLLLAQSAFAVASLFWHPPQVLTLLSLAVMEPIIALPGFIAVALVLARHETARTWTLVGLALFAANWFGGVSMASDFGLFLFPMVGVDTATVRMFAYVVCPALLAVNAAAMWFLFSDRGARDAAAAEPWADSIASRRMR